MKKAATSKKLASAFEKHTEETETHLDILEKAFEALGEKPVAKKRDAVEGLLEEAKSIMVDTESDTMIRDAGLILAVQKVEHYEIANYRTLIAFANHLGNDKVTKLIASTLENEKNTVVALTRIAESYVNMKLPENNFFTIAMKVGGILRPFFI